MFLKSSGRCQSRRIRVDDIFSSVFCRPEIFVDKILSIIFARLKSWVDVVVQFGLDGDDSQWIWRRRWVVVASRTSMNFQQGWKMVCCEKFKIVSVKDKKRYIIGSIYKRLALKIIFYSMFINNVKMKHFIDCIK